MALGATLVVLFELTNPPEGTYVPYWAVPAALGAVCLGFLIMTATVVFPDFPLWREEPLRPKIVLSKCRTQRRPFWVINASGTRSSRWGRYMYVIFENQGTARAPSVAAWLTFMDQEGTGLFGPIAGRWAGSESVSQHGGNRADLNEMGMSPNGIGHALDVAFRFEDGGELFAHNNESQEQAPADWQWGEFRLHHDGKPYPQAFRVLIEILEEPDVHESFWLRVIDNGPNEDPVLEVENP